MGTRSLAVVTLVLVSSLSIGQSKARGCEVEGVVMDFRYAALAHFNVELVSGLQTYKAQSDSNGHFIFPDIPDGEYSLQPGRHYESDYWQPVWKMTKLQISSGVRKQHIDLVLRPRH